MNADDILEVDLHTPERAGCMHVSGTTEDGTFYVFDVPIKDFCSKCDGKGLGRATLTGYEICSCVLVRLREWMAARNGAAQPPRSRRHDTRLDKARRELELLEAARENALEQFNQRFTSAVLHYQGITEERRSALDAFHRLNEESDRYREDAARLRRAADALDKKSAHAADDAYALARGVLRSLDEAVDKAAVVGLDLCQQRQKLSNRWEERLKTPRRTLDRLMRRLGPTDSSAGDVADEGGLS